MKVEVKRPRKKPCPSQSDAAPSTVVPEGQPQPQPDDVDTDVELDVESDVAPAGDVGAAREPEAMGEPADVVEEMELEEQLRDEGEAGGQTRRNVWVDPYDGVPVPEVFPGGPSDTTVLTSYPCHVARYIYDSHERELISPVSNSGKVASFKHEELNTAWWERALKATRFWGLAQTGYSFLDLGLLATFVERWYRDTNTFHLPCGEMTVTLDDVRCLLHIFRFRDAF
ncbi:hypothetical protein P8452_57148 [Trifolium repens]|nr:hypothetical protein P8452_57148 [Trifolium repens]